MGTKMLERSPGELHTYNINREGTKLIRRFRGIEPSTAEAAESISITLSYYMDLIDDNPITITSRNAAAMLTRIGRTEAVAHMGEWWFQEPQLQVCHPLCWLKGRLFQVLQRTASLMHKQIFRCTSEEMAFAMWGISFLGPKLMQLPMNKEGNMDALIHDLVNRLLRDISKLRPIDLTTFVEALARLQYKNINYVMKAITYETKMKIMRYHDTDLPIFLWSLAQLGYPGRDGVDRDGLLSTLAWEAKKRLSKWNALELSRVVWAFGVLGFKSIQHLLSIISFQFIDRLQIKGPPAVKFIWGFNALDHHPGKVTLTKLGRCFSMDLHNLYPRDIATGFLSLLNLGLVDDRVPTRIKEVILRSEVEGWSARDAANAIWALARADFLEQDTFMVLRRYILQCKPSELQEQSQVDLYRCYLHLSMFRPSMAHLLPSTIPEHCQNAWIERQTDIPPSLILGNLLETMASMGYTIKANRQIHDGILFAHTASVEADTQYAIEIIHPPKCFINDPNSISEQQKWREDLLLGWGYKIIRVDEKRWTRMDQGDKTDFLKLQIKRA